MGALAVLFSSKKVNGGTWDVDILAWNNSYPFGMLQPQLHGNTGAYRYGFNGKEMDNEMRENPVAGISGTGNSYDYGFRVYDPRIAKFLSVDPLTADYPMLTPYQFASNTPIQAIDLDGLEAFYVHGTWDKPSTFPKITIATINEITGNTTGAEFAWSGNNVGKARLRAGLELANHVQNNLIPGQPITLVGQSHGGNVAVIAANILQSRQMHVENLITFNTPVREYQLNDYAVSNHVNFSHAFDLVQINGGYNINISDGVLLVPGGWKPTFDGSVSMTGEIGIAGAFFYGAQNFMLMPTISGHHKTHKHPELWEAMLHSAINSILPDLPTKLPFAPADNTKVRNNNLHPVGSTSVPLKGPTGTIQENDTRGPI